MQGIPHILFKVLNRPGFHAKTPCLGFIYPNSLTPLHSMSELGKDLQRALLALRELYRFCIVRAGASTKSDCYMLSLASLFEALLPR